MADNGDNAGWFGDPGDLHRERFHDGGGWTEATRRGRRRSPDPILVERRSRLPLLLLILLIALVVGGAFAWYFTKSTERAAADAVALVTHAPAEADAATLESDAHNLQVQVTAAVVDSGGKVPAVTLEDGYYVVTDGKTPVTVPASHAAASAGITGTTGTNWCVWTATEDSQTWHANPAGEVKEGEC